MTDLAADLSRLAQSPTTKIPVSWYFDPAIAELEQRVLFQPGLGYAGHELMVPNEGDFYALPWLANARALVRHQGGVHLLDNVCRHRQSLLLRGRGNAKNIVCPLHSWTYDLNGTLLGAPHFPANPQLHLQRSTLNAWHGLQFTGATQIGADLANLSCLKEFDFSGYVYDKTVVEDYDFNWKCFMDPYLELYHVEPYHAGLRNFLKSGDFRWEFGARHSAQVCGIASSMSKPGSENFKQWQAALERYYAGKLPEVGAIWFIYYPNVMLEWYPHTLVISTLWPLGPSKCRNVVEFFYPEEVALFERELVELQQACYDEVAREDAEICMHSQLGREALYRSGADDAGPFQSPTEDGLVHFYHYLRSQLDRHLS